VLSRGYMVPMPPAAISQPTPANAGCRVRAAVVSWIAIPTASSSAPIASARVSVTRSPSRGWITEAAAHATAPTVRMRPASHGFMP